jgi:DNA-nicking Smr family endonuclease
MEKAPATRKNSPSRKITGRTAASVTGQSPSSPAKATPIDLREGDHAGLDRTTRRKLSRGNLPVEARLDLHGHNAQQAETRLRAFIQQSASLGHRCVLVITGKGVRGEGFLRRHVPLWLKQPPLGGVVLAISDAIPKDGGAGAIYVMLRRTRSSK